MKIAFASCIDAVDDEEQPVWDRIVEIEPDVLLLLGDVVYMDFGLAVFGSKRPLGWPRKASGERFAETLYDRYRRQWAIPAFRRLLAGDIKVAITWDDHDFAWNNGRGAGTERRWAVPRDKRLISRALHLQFRESLLAGATLGAYPPMPRMGDLLETDDAGIQYSFDFNGVRFVMLDGRSFREDPNDAPDAEMHGSDQRAWLQSLLQAWDGPKVICSGSVMSRSEESWDRYLDYAWLLNMAFDRTIVLTGDIHKNVAPVRHHKNPTLYEVTSSGAARPGFGGDCGNFGVVEIDNHVSVTLYSEEQPSGSSFPIVW